MATPAYIVSPTGVIIPSATATVQPIGTILRFFDNGREVDKVNYASLTELKTAYGIYYNLLVGGDAAPTLTSITPSTCVAADGTTCEVVGTHFIYGWIAWFTPVGQPITDPSAQPLTNAYNYTETSTFWSVGAGQFAAGTYDLVYVGPDGQTVTKSSAFIVSP